MKYPQAHENMMQGAYISYGNKHGELYFDPKLNMIMVFIPANTESYPWNATQAELLRDDWYTIPK